jgi:hypothetical protein
MQHNDLPGYLPLEVEAQAQGVFLPTTESIAKQGAQTYRTIADRLQTAEIDNGTRAFFQGSFVFKECFIGTSPLVTFEARDGSHSEFSPQGIHALASIVREETEDIVSFFAEIPPGPGDPIPRGNDGPLFRFAFLNLPAATRVVKENTTAFPKEAQEDTKEWLRNNPGVWLESDEMSGLLYGYPSWDVKQYIAHQSVFDRFYRLDDSVNKDDIYFIADYWSGYEERTKETENLVREAVIRLFPDITDEEITASVSRKRIEGIGTGGFIGFDDEKDTLFLDLTQKMYMISGVDSVFSYIDQYIDTERPQDIDDDIPEIYDLESAMIFLRSLKDTYGIEKIYYPGAGEDDFLASIFSKDQVWAVDTDAEVEEEIRDKYQFIHGKMIEVVFQPDFFDAVYIQDIHASDDELDTILRTVKDEGIVIFSLNDCMSGDQADLDRLKNRPELQPLLLMQQHNQFVLFKKYLEQ